MGWGVRRAWGSEDRSPDRETVAQRCMSSGWVRALETYRGPGILAAPGGSSLLSPTSHPCSPGSLSCHPEQEGLTLLGISQLVVVKKRNLGGTCEEHISSFRCQGAVASSCAQQSGSSTGRGWGDRAQRRRDPYSGEAFLPPRRFEIIVRTGIS